MIAVAEQQQEVLHHYNPNETKATRTGSDCLGLVRVTGLEPARINTRS